MPGFESSHQIQAVLLIQWLSMKNRLRRRSERLGIIVTTLVTLLWYGFWTAGAVGLFFFVRWAPDSRLERGIPPLLFFVLLYWQATPLLTASMGMSIDLRKMALYPIEVKTLFLVECLLRLLTGLEMLLLLTGVSAGMLARNPRGAPVFLPALALFVLFNILLSAGLRQVLERLLQRRGFRQFFLFVMVMASALPQLMVWSGSGHRVGQRVYRAFGLLPQTVLPTTPLADAYLGHITARDWALLAAWCATAGIFGFVQFRRSFYFDFAAARTEALRPKGRGAWAARL